MLVKQDNPAGVNVPIQALQELLYSSLLAKWGITDPNKYECYGRVYRNKKGNQYIAEAYDLNGEYKEVYWNDKLSAISWFGIGSSMTFELKNTVPVHLVFFVDISALKPTASHRADEEVRNDVQRIIGRGAFGFSLQSIELWLENVIREYPGSRRDERLSAVDMHPIHCFRLNLNLSYNINNCKIS